MIRPERVGATVTTGGVQGGGMFSFALGALFVAFVVYVTARGELPKYLSFFLITPATGTGATATPSTDAAATPGATGTGAAATPSTDAAATPGATSTESGVTGVGASPAD